MRLSRLMRKRFLVVVGVILAVGLVGRYLVLPELHRLYVESRIARFESGPSQRNADALVSLIDRRAATAEQAERIIKLLFVPKVTTRKAYPLGRAPMISVERRFNLHFRNMTVAHGEYVWVQGQNQYDNTAQGGNSFDTAARLLVLHPKPEKPGTYRMEVRYKYSFIPYRKTTTWYWNPLRGRFPRSLLPRASTAYHSPNSSAAPKYECRFTVPVDVVIAEKEQAEQVTCVSNVELDSAMRAAFTSKRFSMTSSTWATPAGRMVHKDTVRIIYEDLPIAAVFRYVFRLADGSEVAVEPYEYDAPRPLRANSSGSFYIDTREFAISEPGRYSGTIILRADPNEAYKDPAIKSIWDGELQFPISFTVEASE